MITDEKRYVEPTNAHWNDRNEEHARLTLNFHELLFDGRLWRIDDIIVGSIHVPHLRIETYLP